MSDIPIAETAEFIFELSGRKSIRVKVKEGEWSEERLKRVAEVYYNEIWAKSRGFRPGTPLVGEWRICKNPECPYAFYAKRHKIKEGKEKSCSQKCRFVNKPVKRESKKSKPKDEPRPVPPPPLPPINISRPKLAGIYQERREPSLSRVSEPPSISVSVQPEPARFVPFREIYDVETICLVVDTTKAFLERKPEAPGLIARLKDLIGKDPERVRKALKDIRTAPRANSFVVKFLETEEGALLKGLMEIQVL